MPGLKEKAARSGWPGSLVWALMTGWASLTHAQEPRVLLLQPEGAPAGLQTALQIQLAGVASLERVASPLPASAAQRIEAASDVAREREAVCAVSVDPPPEHTEAPAVLYVVGPRQGRALIEVVRVPGGSGPELDRTLALKVREIVVELIAARALAPPPAALVQPPTAAPRPGPARASEPPARRVQGVVALSGRLGSQPRIGLGRWGVGLAAGPVWAGPRLRLSPQLGVDWFPAVTVAQAGDEVRFSEVAGTLTLHAQHRAGDVWLGVQAGPQHVWLAARGTTALDVAGKPHPDSLWALLVGLNAEAPIGAQLSVAAELQLQLLLRDLRFGVNERDIVEFGRVRARLGISLILRPFGA